MGDMTQAQTSERERLLESPELIRIEHWRYKTGDVVDDAMDMLRADAEKIRALVAALNEIVITAVDADLRATYQRTALELIVKRARAALAATQSPRSEGARDDTDH